jgi:DNA end-binding protein Ku
MEMAKTLISRMSQSWDPTKYQDDYKSALLTLIEKKVASGGKAPAEAPTKARPSTNVIDLMEVLRQSLSQNRKAKPKAKKTARPHARSRRSAA